jgi:hypothetical protein
MIKALDILVAVVLGLGPINSTYLAYRDYRSGASTWRIARHFGIAVLIGLLFYRQVWIEPAFQYIASHF